jgi:hypothetical protein
MKKYIFTESQIKKIIDSQLNEQMSPDASFNAVYANPPISQQMKKFPKGKFAFSMGRVKELDQDKTNRLYMVKPGDTVSGLVQKLGANSEYNILYDNDLLKNNPKALQVGMVICYSLRPSGN